ncbi:MAG: hypothetical protein AB7T37_14295 [Dehalococcoidia bacterium]
MSPRPEYAVSREPVGEAGVVYDRGGAFISLVGAGYSRFHSTTDRWPEGIDAPAIAAIRQGVVETLRALDSSTILSWSATGPWPGSPSRFRTASARWDATIERCWSMANGATNLTTGLHFSRRRWPPI